jgi:hypothetical protein
MKCAKPLLLLLLMANGECSEPDQVIEQIAEIIGTGTLNVVNGVIIFPPDAVVAFTGAIDDGDVSQLNLNSGGNEREQPQR